MAAEADAGAVRGLDLRRDLGGWSCPTKGDDPGFCLLLTPRWFLEFTEVILELYGSAQGGQIRLVATALLRGVPRRRAFFVRPS